MFYIKCIPISMCKSNVEGRYFNQIPIVPQKLSKNLHQIKFAFELKFCIDIDCGCIPIEKKKKTWIKKKCKIKQNKKAATAATTNSINHNQHTEFTPYALYWRYWLCVYCCCCCCCWIFRFEFFSITVMLFDF